jgi:predicted RNA-binding Zn-ribbon protein involved in translation (DUF1610 family)
MADNVKIVPASCTQCGGTVEVDKGSDTAICPFCGTSFIVEKAINNYNVQNATIEHADNVNIDMTGSVKTVLDFVGDQMKESRAERREARKEAAERGRMMSMGFFKLFGIMFAAMMVFAFGAFIYFQVTDSGSDVDSGYVYSEDNTISCFIDGDGLLSVNITDPGMSVWQYYYEESTERLMDQEADFDGYHFDIAPATELGTGYAVVAEYEDGEMVDTYPISYGIVKFAIESHKISEILEVTHVNDLSSYNFGD